MKTVRATLAFPAESKARICTAQPPRRLKATVLDHALVVALPAARFMVVQLPYLRPGGLMRNWILSG